MKVTDPSIQSSQQAEASRTNRAKEAAKAQRTREANKTENAAAAGDPGAVNTNISGRAKEMAMAKTVATSADDVREAKIAELKRRIASKEYNVKPDAIADRMVDEHLQTRGLE